MYNYNYPKQCPFTRSQCGENCALCVSRHPETCAFAVIAGHLSDLERIDNDLKAITEKLAKTHVHGGADYDPDLDPDFFCPPRS